jgi:hypothetical protein
MRKRMMMEYGQNQKMMSKKMGKKKYEEGS